MKVKEAVNRLNGYYFKGDIVYPRVSGGYMGELFDFIAHPSLNRVDFFSLPLLKETYPVDKNTLLLYLHHKGLVLPSEIAGINSFIKTVFYTDKKRFLIPLNKIYINNTLSKFLDFCAKKQINIKTYNKFRISNFPQKFLYTVRLKPTPVTVKARKELKKEKSKKNYHTVAMKYDGECFDEKAKIYDDEKNDFFEALERFKKKRLMYKYFLADC